MLNENIKKYRQILGLTQKQLADIVGISGAFMSLIEQGKNNPSEENLKKIAEALNVSVEELTIEESNTPTEEILNLLIKLTENEIIGWSILDYGDGDREISSRVNDVLYHFYFYSLENNNNCLMFKGEELYPTTPNERKLFKKLYDTIMIYCNINSQIYKTIRDLQNLLSNTNKE
ncbi:helix-turn-helix transcriptional regulator [uncultured Anaerococcus sp.]|uniref:helix-turn-helix domain-containing protein n=1 Tax=uncultured Anaerococcus sp. TaxID=293428 RepID=UPI002889F5B3|nr:helix-turn-helix transcriptional regulator [uncultured Anaerococcus sp.]